MGYMLTPTEYTGTLTHCRLAKNSSVCRFLSLKSIETPRRDSAAGGAPRRWAHATEQANPVGASLDFWNKLEQFFGWERR